MDSSAALRYVDGGAGADRYEEILGACAALDAEVLISAVQWGEIAGKLRARFGPSEDIRILGYLLPSEATVAPATAERAVRAAALKVDRKIGYADAFALDLAMESKGRILVTADYDFQMVRDLVEIEFLPRPSGS
jgi:predicted nucleic acid-binding protein